MSLPNNITLGPGDEGMYVVTLQQMLSGRGYLSPDGIDGVYGAMTRRAVQAFQGANGLLVDGVAGPRTIRKLNGLPDEEEDTKLPGSGTDVVGAALIAGAAVIAPMLGEENTLTNAQAGLDAAKDNNDRMLAAGGASSFSRESAPLPESERTSPVLREMVAKEVLAPAAERTERAPTPNEVRKEEPVPERTAAKELPAKDIPVMKDGRTETVAVAAAQEAQISPKSPEGKEAAIEKAPEAKEKTPAKDGKPIQAQEQRAELTPAELKLMEIKEGKALPQPEKELAQEERKDKTKAAPSNEPTQKHPLHEPPKKEGGLTMEKPETKEKDSSPSREGKEGRSALRDEIKQIGNAAKEKGVTYDAAHHHETPQKQNLPNHAQQQGQGKSL